MKNSCTCPKCNSNNIIKIPGTVGAYGAGNNIRYSTFSYVKVTRYVCCDCGYSEEWIDNREDIEKLKKKYSYN